MTKYKRNATVATVATVTLTAPIPRRTKRGLGTFQNLACHFPPLLCIKKLLIEIERWGEGDVRGSPRQQDVLLRFREVRGGAPR